MTPTPEQVAAMEARGWFVRPEFPLQFTANPSCRIVMRVRPWVGPLERWIACYGWAGVDLSSHTQHATPEAAAAEAEAWLRGELSGFCFPWLTVTPAREPGAPRREFGGEAE